MRTLCAARSGCAISSCIEPGCSFLQPVEGPLDRHPEHVLTSGLVSAGGRVGVVHQRMYVAKAPLELTFFPRPGPRCAMGSERWCYAARPAELTPSKTAPATLSRLRSSIHHLLRRSAHHSPTPPRRQIAIDGHCPRRPPRVPSLEAFGRRPSARVDRSRRAGIRNPSQEEPFPARRLSGREGSNPAAQSLPPERPEIGASGATSALLVPIQPNLRTKFLDTPSASSATPRSR